MFDPAATIDDLAWLRSIWPGPLVVKGILTVADARAVVDAGADAVVVSNHGGRQLDRAPTPLEVLPPVVDAVGDRAEVYVDGGILSGSDVVAAVALGARAALVGRAYLYGLMAGGERGVERAADILLQEVASTLALLGVTRCPIFARTMCGSVRPEVVSEHGRHRVHAHPRAVRLHVRRRRPGHAHQAGHRAAALVRRRVRRCAAQRRRPVQRQGRPAFRQPADRPVLRRGRRARRHARRSTSSRWSRPGTGAPRRPSRSSAA